MSGVWRVNKWARRLETELIRVFHYEYYFFFVVFVVLCCYLFTLITLAGKWERWGRIVLQSPALRYVKTES